MPGVEPLEQHFLRVARPEGGADRVAGKRIPWRPTDYVARNARDEPLLLIAADSVGGYPAIQLRHLRVDFGARCKISEDGGVETEGDFVVIAGQELTPEFVTLFLRVMDGLLRSLPDRPALSQVRQSVHDVAELFRVLEMPARRSVQGLWAELFVVGASGDTGRWLQAWRTTATEKFDFAFDALRVEVKSAQALRRIHSFSLEQVTLPADCVAYVASVLVRQSASGTGVVELANRLCAEVAQRGDLVDKIWRNVAEALGRDFSESTDLRFDEAHAHQMLRFVPARLVPKPRLVDAEVTNVRFDSNLDAITLASGVRRIPELHDL